MSSSFRRAAVMVAAALLAGSPAMAQMAPAAKPKPAMAHPAVAKPAPAKPAAKRGPRTATSLACSKQADGKNLHGAARTSFMRSCNKG